MATLDVSASVVDALDVVRVTVTAASPGDWIGVYCLSSDGASPSIDDYLDRRDAQEPLVFGPLVNMRCALQFKLLSQHGDVRATAKKLARFRHGHAEPTQRRLAVTTSPTEMRVAWTSSNVTEHHPRVRFGLTAKKMTHEVPAIGITYDADDMCAAPATTRSARQFRDPGVFYDATMTGLTPGKTYYYQVGSAVKWSDVRTFRVPPQGGQDDGPMSFFVFGDLMDPTDALRDFRIPGSCGTTMELITRDFMAQDTDHRQYEALIHVGDLSYAAGQTFVWDHFGALIEPVSSRLPYMVSLGNHDFGYLEGRQSKHLRAPVHAVFDMDETKGFDSHGECGVPTEARFRMPENGRGLLWYSFEMGLTHHTILSGEHDFSIGSPMHTWLVQDLARVDRRKTPWLFVHIHRPLYCSVAFRGDWIRSLYLRDHLEYLFAKHRVDIVFSGHYHSYERTCPVYDDQCLYGPQGDVRAPVHIMVGSGGANVDTFGHYRVRWSESAKLVYGYGRLHVYNTTHTLFEFVENSVRDVTDSMWIVTDHKWTAHENWRWRRVVLNPSLSFMITTAVLMVVLGLASIFWRRRRRGRLVHRIPPVRKGK